VRNRVLTGLGSLLVLASACTGGHPAAFMVVDSQEGRCGVFATCYDVTIRNEGDVSGQAVCSLSQYRKGDSDPKNTGTAVTSSYVEPGEQGTVTLSIHLKDHQGYTRPLPSCGPGVPTD